MKASIPTLDIVIVNWNAGHQIQECLLSICHAKREGLNLNRVIIVDNGSTDNSTSGLSCLDVPLMVIQNTINRGFAVACNQGAAGSGADYLLFLNPDTKLFPDTLTKSVECMNRPENSQIGILGVQILNERNQVSRSCARFPTTKMFVSNMLGLNKLIPSLFPDHFYLEWDHHHSRSIEQVIGAYFLIRNSVFKEVNGFDERFFVYFEEVDLSLRAWRAGWSTYYLATAQCYHSGGGSSHQIRARRLFYSLQSRIYYGFKHFRLLSAVMLLLAAAFLEPLSRIGRASVQGSMSQIKEVIHAYLLVWRALPRILSSRHLRRTETLKLNLNISP